MALSLMLMLGEAQEPEGERKGEGEEGGEIQMDNDGQERK